MTIPSRQATGSPGFDDIVMARLFEFWGRNTSWERSLWSVGTVAQLDELSEACGAGISAEAQRDFKNKIQRLAELDEGLGDNSTRQLLREILKENLTANPVGRNQFDLLVPRVRAGYLARWASAARATPPPRAEVVARHVAAHLLDTGYSADHLYRWLAYKTKYQAPSPSLPDLLDDADTELGEKNPQTYRVLVPVIAAPQMTDPEPAAWRSAAEVSHLVQSWGGNTSGLRQNGGFLLEVSELDRFAAASAAREVIDRWNARVELATGDSLLASPKVWIEDEAQPVFPARPRNLEVHALQREHQLYADPMPNQWAVRIDNAFQLAQSAVSGSPSAAIAGAWASIESLLTVEGEDKYLGAPRLAAIVACSVPRAELTRLSYVHQTYGKDQLAEDLSGKSNLERSELIVAALTSGQAIATHGTGDEAAVLRMKLLLDKPYEVLARIQEYLEGSIKRLYRQRNLLLHAGLVTGKARKQTLRGAPVLVGAGLDRIAHAWFVEEIDPLTLAALAQNGLSLLKDPSGPSLTRLLEP